jgi:tRNA threonylcarbamoyladenosine dehydratase
MDKQEYKPIIIKDDEELKKVFESKPHLLLVDAFSRQIKELFFIDNHTFIGEDKEKVYESEEFKRYADKKKKDCTCFFFPWNCHVVKCANEKDYLKLKTNRNQDLITAEEQEKLLNYNVAVLGMSVGSNIAFVLTQAGISGKIVIADNDELDTTNLNRIFAGVHQIGLNKTIIAARKIYEDNPYADVKIYPEGITEENLDALLKSGEVNCIIEEIDDIKMKIETRKLALKHKIPVVMITDNGDGVILHVERYDLGYGKIFDEDQVYWEGKIDSEITKEIAGDIIINNIVGGPQNVDPRMLASVQRFFKKELVSWSQLGSAAMLGGVAATVAIKRMALGTSKQLTVREFISPDMTRKKPW